MKILLIAPKCFPVGGAESIVNIKLLQAFSQYDDILVDVVSRSYQSNVYPTGEIKQYGVNINKLYIIKSCNKLNLKTAWQTFMCLLYFGCTFRGAVWAYVALPTVKRLIEKNHYDFILTKNAPSFLLGSYLHKRGFKWVASWNDPYPHSFYPYPYGKGNHHKPSIIERLIIRQMSKADYHVFPSEMLMKHMREYVPINADRACVIPHVILVRDNMYAHHREEKRSKVLNIIHSGNLGNVRNPQSFFKAVEAILTERNDVRMTVTVLGCMAEKDIPTKEIYPKLSQCIECIPPVEYSKSLEILSHYSLACIIEAPCREGEAVFLPTKLTDFMQIGIPIITISPKGGVLHQMYKNGNIGYFGDVNDVQSIKDSLLMAWNDFSSPLGLKQNVIDKRFLPSAVVKSYYSIANKLLGV